MTETLYIEVAEPDIDLRGKDFDVEIEGPYGGRFGVPTDDLVVTEDTLQLPNPERFTPFGDDCTWVIEASDSAE
ncbi:hypothetical protein NDI85_19985 [Halomicroarcula sp. S1AR25-4]|uniref:hypothetical protein n=1 Tax=Haloarcula sp. S1AR25-4 TaxID=2950538 RepID=UPI0028770243|nr:hypothetical protein [Halomicroarcula sp. S1AR25-4]MDS0280069.1 hypothetical protein [Halomicroarcula sp. S1AR25-4]